MLYNELKKGNYTKLNNSLLYLTDALYEIYNKKVILLIDEYDNPIINSYKYNYFDKIIKFLSIFYGSSLKTNFYLEMGVLTGLSIQGTSYDTSINNISTKTCFDNQYTKDFGFT